MGWAYLLLGDYDIAIDWLLKARASNSRYLPVHTGLAAAFAQKDDGIAAHASLADALKIQPNLSITKIKSDAGLSVSVAQGDKRLLDALQNVGAKLRPQLNTDPNLESKYAELMERTYYAGLRKAGLPEQ